MKLAYPPDQAVIAAAPRQPSWRRGPLGQAHGQLHKLRVVRRAEARDGVLWRRSTHHTAGGSASRCHACKKGSGGASAGISPQRTHPVVALKPLVPQPGLLPEVMSLNTSAFL